MEQSPLGIEFRTRYLTRVPVESRRPKVAFKKVLIANRGEIALRVIRACRDLGLQSVAVYSDADARAVHVREADEAIHIGGSPSSESYLVGQRMIDAARRAGAEAIHPGYGFLSEREWFARAVRDAGLVFVGPPAEAIAAMGSKTSARQLAMSAGTPVVPGTTAPLEDLADARSTAARFKYPVLLKAAAGGGPGIRREGHARRARGVRAAGLVRVGQARSKKRLRR
jgi:acetyl-CoA carboxylase, biotin carboxylase subunit